MSRMPRGLSGQEVKRALERAGFVFARQRSSHIIMVRDDPKARVVIPDHHEVRIGTLHQILNDANMSVEEFTKLL